MLTTQQAAMQARGLAAAQQRVQERNRITLHFEWNANLRASTIQKTVERALESDGVIITPVDADREATFLRHQVNRRDQQIEYLQAEIARLNSLLDMRGDTAAERREEITLSAWAKRMNISYSTAWRRVQAECIQYRPVGNGTKHNGYMVYPDTYVPPIVKTTKKKARRK